MMVLKAIQDLEKKRNARIKDPLFSKLPIPVPINVGSINGGKVKRKSTELHTQ